MFKQLKRLFQSAASTAAFVLAMINYPEVQEKAQAEIDRVIGRSRLPTYSDRESLPYIYAIYKEVLRWHTVVPQGNTSVFVYVLTFFD